MKEAILLGGGGGGQGARVGEGGWGLMLGWYLKINFGLLKIFVGLPPFNFGSPTGSLKFSLGSSLDSNIKIYVMWCIS